jgi:asparagine synthetase B (glutamine-hydrolysing)
MQHAIYDIRGFDQATAFVMSSAVPHEHRIHASVHASVGASAAASNSAPGDGSAAVVAKPLVVAALSGGVDSATAAALLVEQGHQVVGMTMRLYDARGTAASSGGRCCGPRDVEDARAV